MEFFLEYTTILQNQKTKKGAILTGLNRAASFMFPDEWNQPNIKQNT